MDGARVSNTWWTEGRSVWEEYGHLFSVMGKAYVSSGDLSPHYVTPGKLTLDWLSTSQIVRLEPYGDDDQAQCNPCGPYLPQRDALRP